MATHLDIADEGVQVVLPNPPLQRTPVDGAFPRGLEKRMLCGPIPVFRLFFSEQKSEK